jgi:hypothetical protein
MKILNQLFDKASGSIGNFTVAGSQGGMYMKIKSNPDNPNTNKQQIVRNAMATATISWKNLTHAQRAVWEDWGKTLVKEDILGNKLKISGWSAFAGAFVIRVRAGLTTNGMAPTSILKDYASSSLFTTENGGANAVIKSGVTTDRTIAIYKSPFVRNTVNNFGGTYEFVKAGNIKTSNSMVVSTKVGAKQRMFVKLVVSEANGRHSLPIVLTIDG